MRRAEAGATAATLVVAGLGAAAFLGVGFPAAALTGSAAAVTLAALAGMAIHVPGWLRVLAFTMLGIGIGSGLSPEVLQRATAWPVTIAILAASLVLGLVVARAGLERGLGWDRRSATLGAAPGHLSYVISLAMDTGADTTRVALVQSIRVLILTLCVPLAVAWLFGATGAALLPAQTVAPLHLLATVALALALGAGLERLSVPAAYLLAGMAVSGLGHGSGLTPGRLPDPVAVASFLVMGTLIGSRFRGLSRATLGEGLAAGLWVTTVTMAVATAAVALAMVLTGFPPGLLIVAFAPGGVEAMAAIAVTLGLDPAFVALHHVLRLMMLTALIPALLPRGPAG